MLYPGNYQTLDYLIGKFVTGEPTQNIAVRTCPTLSYNGTVLRHLDELQAFAAALELIFLYNQEVL